MGGEQLELAGGVLVNEQDARYPVSS